MTWIEIVFFIGILVPFIFGCILDADMDGGVTMCLILPILYATLFGALPSLIVNSNTTPTLISETPLKMLSQTMVNDKMIVITDQADKVEFESYKDIQAIKNGKTLVKKRYEKHVYYGPDSSWDNVEIK